MASVEQEDVMSQSDVLSREIEGCLSEGRVTQLEVRGKQERRPLHSPELK